MIPASDTVRRPRALEGGRRVYVAGPMTGYPGQNFPAFDAAARLLRSRLGVVPVNPADLDRDEFPGYDGSAPPDGFMLNRMMARDLRELGECDAVVLLPGWRASRGANIERDRAILLGIPRWRLVADRYLVPDHQGVMVEVA